MERYSLTLGSFKVNVSVDGLYLGGICHAVERSIMEINFILGDNFIRQANVLITKDCVKFWHSEDVHEKEIMRIHVDKYVEGMDVAPQYALDIKNLVENYSPKVPAKRPIELKIVLTDKSPIYSRLKRLWH